MRDDLTALNADFTVWADGASIALIPESAGGTVAGSAQPRNGSS
ncbi:hypothetical protein [Actinokineospora enzanensis]|nr:hypothetical protein [Actinokineospora enzanensis]